MNISICTPTLNRYDLLGELIESLQQGSLRPDHIYVIDNGGKLISQPASDIVADGVEIHYRNFGHNLGCAESWNWFMKNVPDIRIICNDDVLFAPDALKNWAAAYDQNQIVCPDSLIGSNAFSAFMIPDGVVWQVGLFDETISPNYAYLEDNDYAYRMKMLGSVIQPAPNCLLTHGESSTLKEFSPGQMREHHERFRRAQINYSSKWGGLPGYEVYDKPYDGMDDE